MEIYLKMFFSSKQCISAPNNFYHKIGIICRCILEARATLSWFHARYSNHKTTLETLDTVKWILFQYTDISCMFQQVL